MDRSAVPARHPPTQLPNQARRPSPRFLCEGFTASPGTARADPPRIWDGHVPGIGSLSVIFLI